MASTEGSRSFLIVITLTITLAFLVGNVSTKKRILMVREEGEEETQATTPKSMATETGLPGSTSSIVLTKVGTMKPKQKFKGPESNCASAFDPCYFPRSICCKWQSECSWDMSPDDCQNDKDEFCCKYM